jgi:hypothetical protein
MIAKIGLFESPDVTPSGFSFWSWMKRHLIIPLQSTRKREQLGDRRNVGESSCNSGDGTGQMAQALMFMMMMKREAYKKKCL